MLWFWSFTTKDSISILYLWKWQKLCNNIFWKKKSWLAIHGWLGFSKQKAIRHNTKLKLSRDTESSKQRFKNIWLGYRFSILKGIGWGNDGNLRDKNYIYGEFNKAKIIVDNKRTIVLQIKSKTIWESIIVYEKISDGYKTRI